MPMTMRRMRSPVSTRREKFVELAYLEDMGPWGAGVREYYAGSRAAGDSDRRSVVGALPRRGEEVDQCTELGRAEMAELLVVKPGDRLVEAGEELHPLPRDAGEDHAAVVLGALALDEVDLFHPVEQASDVGYLGHEAVADFVAAEALLARAAQDAQHVVLRRRDVVCAE